MKEQRGADVQGGLHIFGVSKREKLEHGSHLDESSITKSGQRAKLPTPQAFDIAFELSTEPPTSPIVSAICFLISSFASECKARKMDFLKFALVGSSTLAQRSSDKELYELRVFWSQTHTDFLVDTCASGAASICFYKIG